MRLPYVAAAMLQMALLGFAIGRGYGFAAIVIVVCALHVLTLGWIHRIEAPK